MPDGILANDRRGAVPEVIRKLHLLPDFPTPSPRQASWWLCLDEDRLEKQEREYVDALTRLSSEIQTVSGREYSTLHRSLEHDKLRDSKQIWMATVYGAAVNVSSKRIEKARILNCHHDLNVGEWCRRRKSL
jgi:hypothetical protein